VPALPAHRTIAARRAAAGRVGHGRACPDDARLPALTLQPLLENAVYHGIEPRRAGGCIRISGRTAGATACISASSNPLPQAAGSTHHGHHARTGKRSPAYCIGFARRRRSGSWILIQASTRPILYCHTGQRLMRILIADDELPGSRAPAQSAGARNWVGCEVAGEAGSGLEVTRALIDSTQPVEVVLLDIRMPEMDGLETAHGTSDRLNPAPAVIFTTAYQEHALAAFESNAPSITCSNRYKRDRLHEALGNGRKSSAGAGWRRLERDPQAGGSSRNYLSAIVQGRISSSPRWPTSAISAQSRNTSPPSGPVVNCCWMNRSRRWNKNLPEQLPADSSQCTGRSAACRSPGT
jgi:CheY-like chemotaxis protein